MTVPKHVTVPKYVTVPKHVTVPIQPETESPTIHFPLLAPVSDEDEYRREHSLFLSNRNVTHFRTISNSDKVYFCIRQLNSSNVTELHLTGPPYLNIESNDVTPFNVTTRTPLVSCVFVDETETGKVRWSTEGMEVNNGPSTT